jgi:uncharacterized protein YjbI with pentapeptide repeats
VPCCMADDYNDWCKDLEIVYKDKKRKEYCVFHAPQGKKGVSLEKFNAFVFQRVEDIRKTGKEAPGSEQECNLSGTIFEGDISFPSFKGAPDLPRIDFSRAQFSGGANFGWAQFSGRAYFSAAQFSGRADFGAAQFSGWADFSRAQFSGEADFSRAQFSGEASFWGAQFSGWADFSRAQFSGEADFWGAQFSGGADFGEAQFSGKTKFSQTYFGEEIIFTNVIMETPPSFEELRLENLRFVDTDVRKIDFINCTWHEKNGRRILYDEREIPSGALDSEARLDEEGTPLAFFVLKKRLKIFWSPPDDRVHAIQKIETVYRRLKQKYKEDQNEGEASMWHYSEKEMQRRKSCPKHFFEFLTLHLYWLSSGYGERPLRAFGVLFGLIAAACVALAWLGFDMSDIYKGFGAFNWNNLPFTDRTKAVIVNVFKYLTFQRDPYLLPLTQSGECVKLAAQVLIPIQAALFVLALRNRFRR